METGTEADRIEPTVETAEDTPPAPAHDRRMLEALVCPQTGGPLRYDAEAQELTSKSAGLAYPIRSGIPIMLVGEARKLD